MQREKYGEYAKMLREIFAYEEDYDDIVRTFRQMGPPVACVNTTGDAGDRPEAGRSLVLDLNRLSAE